MWGILFTILFIRCNVEVGGKSVVEDMLGSLETLQDEVTGLVDELRKQESKDGNDEEDQLEKDIIQNIDETNEKGNDEEDQLEKDIIQNIDETNKKGNDEEEKDIFQIIDETNEKVSTSLPEDGIVSADGKHLHLVESDIVVTDYVRRIIEANETNEDIGSDAIADKKRKWPKAVLPFYFGSGASSKMKRAVRAAADELRKVTCIDCKELSKSQARKYDDYVEIIKGSGCYSYIGKVGGKQDISIGSGCEYKGVVIHEFMHALGFWHEQSRIDRDNHVEIIFENIYKGYENNFRKYKRGSATTQGTAYDKGSLMHYGPYAFSKNRKPTIVPRSGDLDSIGQRKGLSKLDVIGLNKLYCDGVKPPGLRCDGQDNGCCTSKKPCDLGEGDCDKDSHCAGSLVCGTDNCPWGDGDDCCIAATDMRCNGQENGCCTSRTPCKLGEGDCDRNSHCIGSLICGKNNCPWGDNDDCCMEATGLRCNGQNNGCCTSRKPCEEGEGDCDKDSHCIGSLICGKDNCPWRDNDDCCMKA